VIFNNVCGVPQFTKLGTPWGTPQEANLTFINTTKDSVPSLSKKKDSVPSDMGFFETFFNSHNSLSLSSMHACVYILSNFPQFFNTYSNMYIWKNCHHEALKLENIG
jgi:hypothetical protein